MPVRDPDTFLSRLLWCDSHREELAEMTRNAYRQHATRDWSDVATDFERHCRAGLESKRPAGSFVNV